MEAKGLSNQLDVTLVQKVARDIIDNVSKVLVGKEKVIEEALCALLCDGHILAEDVPGVGKTMLARALAKSIGLSFRRIQFTPDLLPSDVIGVTVYNQKTGDFSFRNGPVFAHVVLADEINRGTPRTQSALLECMEEKQVTVDGERRVLERPFIVLATQNPIEFEGTFPLPEAQLDRFFIRIHLGYPDETAEIEMLERLSEQHPIETIDQVVDIQDLLTAQQLVRQVHVARSVTQYVVQLVKETRSHPDVALGASPRGSLALFRAAQAYAALSGRGYVVPDDVKRMVPSVLGHRLLLTPEAAMRGRRNEDITVDILKETPVEAQATEAQAVVES